MKDLYGMPPLPGVNGTGAMSRIRLFHLLVWALALCVPAAHAADRAVVAVAAGYIGKASYLLGGEDPKTGIDCSGLTRLAYLRAHQRELPHHAADQFRLGSPVDKGKLQAGDLVFFGHGNEITHVGIATGTGRFIHSASREGGVAISLLSDPYYADIYMGARRLTGAAEWSKKMTPGKEKSLR